MADYTYTALRAVAWSDPRNGETVRLIPTGWALGTVEARSYRMASGVSVSRWEIRAYDPGRPGRPQYRRTRRDGYQPIILADRLSGEGIAPLWMRRAVSEN